MGQTAGFGRRKTPAQTPSSAPRRLEPTGPPDDLSPAARAFLQADQPGRLGEDEAFKAWRRAQAPGRVMAWVVGFALLTPGLICFALAVPTPVAAGVELAGVVIGWHLRRTRRQHLSRIAGWRVGEA